MKKCRPSPKKHEDWLWQPDKKQFDYNFWTFINLYFRLCLKKSYNNLNNSNANQGKYYQNEQNNIIMMITNNCYFWTTEICRIEKTIIASPRSLTKNKFQFHKLLLISKYLLLILLELYIKEEDSPSI